MSVYYNEFDPKAAAWLRELMKAGLIPEGEVDERDIRQVKPEEVSGFTQAHFFAGIGGWAYALRLAGWPDSVPVWTGSCPCQPFSVAGQRKGTADERHLWPDWFRLLAESRPTVVFGEQVASADGLEWLDGVFADLEGAGYACGSADMCAASVGSPHRRQRLFWVADSDGRESGDGGVQRGREHGQRTQDGLIGIALGDANEPRWKGHRPELPRRRDKQLVAESGPVACELGDTTSRGRGEFGDAARTGDGGHAIFPGWARFDLIPCRDGKARRVEPGTFPLAHGIPGRVGLLRGYGNAIVPQVAAEFIRAFREVKAEQSRTTCR